MARKNTKKPRQVLYLSEKGMAALGEAAFVMWFNGMARAASEPVALFLYDKARSNIGWADTVPEGVDPEEADVRVFDPNPWPSIELDIEVSRRIGESLEVLTAAYFRRKFDVRVAGGEREGKA